MDVTFYENADPEAVAKIQLGLANLKPACLDCGKNLSAKDLKQGRLCLDHPACRLRRILHKTPKQGFFFSGRR